MIARINIPMLRTVATCAAVLIAVLCVRTFCLGSYRISTVSMENTLHEGDYVLVNKLAAGSPKRNQIILFLSPLMKDRNNAPLLVSRCIAIPGDTIQVSDAGYRINGILYPRSPNALSSYNVGPEIRNRFTYILQNLNIPLRNMKEAFSGITASLTSFEEYTIREELTAAENKRFKREETGNYQLIVPKKGDVYHLTGPALTACREAIRTEANGTVEFRNRKLYLNGRETNEFRFGQDYCWALSDNAGEAIDSRHLGFIPTRNIIGNAWLCWYSRGKERAIGKIN